MIFVFGKLGLIDLEIFEIKKSSRDVPAHQTERWVFLKLAPQLSLRERDVLVLLLELVLGRARVASFAAG